MPRSHGLRLSRSSGAISAAQQDRQAGCGRGRMRRTSEADHY
jgi:hypothetical protein